VLARHVQNLLALLRREPAPDVPRRQGNTDGTETPGESWPHEAILAQALAFAPVVVVLPVAVAVAVAFAVVVPVVFLAPVGRVLVRRRRNRGLVSGLVSVAISIAVSVA
jgi:hypothetical protein